MADRSLGPVRSVFVWCRAQDGSGEVRGDKWLWRRDAWQTGRWVRCAVCLCGVELRLVAVRCVVTDGWLAGGSTPVCSLGVVEMLMHLNDVSPFWIVTATILLLWSQTKLLLPSWLMFS
jgi:hypothetical protein